MLDAVRRYDIDGVHFDDYFYPYPVAARPSPTTRRSRGTARGFADRAAWRRDNVDRLVHEIDERVHAAQAVGEVRDQPVRRVAQPVHRPARLRHAGLQSYDAISADTRGWVREGWIDYIAPQIYWYIGFAAADYAKLVPWWAEQAEGTGVQLFIGQADYRQGAPGQPPPWQDPAELSRHLTLNLAHPQITGDVHFSAKDVAADRIGAVRLWSPTTIRRPRSYRSCRGSAVTRRRRRACAGRGRR